MNDRIGKLKALFGTVDNVVKTTGSKRISRFHIDDLQAHKAVFLKEKPGHTTFLALNVIEKTLAYIDVYNNGDDFEELKKVVAAVVEALDAVEKALV